MNQAVKLQSLFHEARQAYASGRHEQAVSTCDRLLSVGGAREEFLNLKAMALLAQGRARDASAAMARALKKNPRDPGLHLNAARIDLVLAERREAKRHAMEAVRLASNDPRTLYQAAIVCRQCGDYDRALRLVERCRSRAPDLAEASHLAGSMHMDRGDRESARTCLEAALASQPGHARSLADLARLEGDLGDHPQLRRQLQQVAMRGASPWDRSACLFALADWHHRDGDTERAAGYYRQANAEGASVRPFDLEAWEAKQAATLERFAALTPRGKPGHGEGAGLVFLVGMPRSGTSLCEQVLGAHPEVLACGELSTLHAIELHSPVGASDADRRRAYYAALPREHDTAARITDKLPMNFERVGLIHELFPGARFLHCRRHPLDTILSCYQQDFQSGVQWAFDLDAITRVFIAQARLMAHWRERLPDHVYPVDYEDLVRDLAGTAGVLTEFLDLDLVPAMLEPHRSERTVQTASRLQVRESVYTTSVEKWRRYENLLAPARKRLEAAGLLP